MDFLPQTYTRRRSASLKYLGGFFVLLATFLGIGLYEFGRSHLLIATPAGVPRDALQLADTILSTEGGDITANPPIVSTPQVPVLNGEPPDPDTFTAHAILVKDITSGLVLYKKNEYDRWPIASVTKLMSALVVLERTPDWVTSTQVVSDDLIDTHMYAGDTYTISDLWNSALIGSSNKAIMTLADAVGWERAAFVARMNEKATELGMTNTTFLEPTGLDDGNVSTASDVAILLDEALHQDQIRQGLLTKEYNLYSEERESAHHLWNTNWLILGWIPSKLFNIVGGKTGYISTSGYNYVMETVDDAGHTLAVIVLGTDSHEARFTEARDIAEWAFSNYTWPQ